MISAIKANRKETIKIFFSQCISKTCDATSGFIFASKDALASRTRGIFNALKHGMKEIAAPFEVETDEA